MRVISGSLKGLHIPQPKSGEIRPTTDRAKESLFNILDHQIDLSSIKALDLFCGSGNISFELVSRGCKDVISVELNFSVVKQLRTFIEDRRIEGIKVVKANAFDFIRRDKERYDLIFADPPYQLAEINTLPLLIEQNGILNPGGTLIIEHTAQLKWNHPSCYESRHYGQSVFSFFKF